MTETPEEIPQIVEKRRVSLTDEIGKNERILAMLSDMDPADMVSVSAVCAYMQAAASEKSIPKEDSAMTKTDIRRYVQDRLPMLFATLCLVYSTLYLTPKWINAMFAQPKLKAEGGYELFYTFSLENLFAYWLIGVVGLSSLPRSYSPCCGWSVIRQSGGRCTRSVSRSACFSSRCAV